MRALNLDRDQSAPLYRQIHDSIRMAIESGQLRPGDRLPSARSLAAQLHAARGTIDTAYALLSGEGYIISRGPRGTIVSPELAPSTPAPRRRPARPARAAALPAVRPLEMGLPALDAFPRKLWSRLVARQARMTSPASLAYPDPAGFGPLREAIAGYLATSRGIACTASQVIVCAGYQGGVGLIARVLLRPGDQAWFEDPGYLRARRALEHAGARLVPVPVDAAGLDVAAGRRRAPRARFAVVTPSHHSPLGVSLSLPRRQALLAWAETAGAFVIEDDYDSEFRYSGRPLPALKSLDRGERVLYVGSFSKTLFPSLRLGYLVVPDGLVEAFATACRLFGTGLPALEQAVVANFIAQGHFARHLRRMRGLYGARRDALAEALARTFGAALRIDHHAGGMHLVARLPAGADDVALAQAAAAHGLAPGALRDCAIEVACDPALLLSFTNVAERDAPRIARRLREALPGIAGAATPRSDSASRRK
ncbi:MocR-like pyridoxine biosynthesis transcription factor PdxR [Bradyrhizobium sp. 2TAF24]|uniref:MocR-like pyridoxine biosynthesis transcription factor PdxR n=1 Tax=Bradyrhizobium sp. 2TAF24 TaxID=3233011 RepID=UPI003F92242C